MDGGTLCFEESKIGLCYLWGFDWEENPEKDWGNGKEYTWAESGICVFNIVREKN